MNSLVRSLIHPGAVCPGSHGDGDPQNTETPIVVWGSGVRGPELASPEDDVDDGVLFVDQHTGHETTPDLWGLKHIERTDINQGDIAPLMVSHDVCNFGSIFQN